MKKSELSREITELRKEVELLKQEVARLRQHTLPIAPAVPEPVRPPINPTYPGWPNTPFPYITWGGTGTISEAKDYGPTINKVDNDIIPTV